MKRLPTAVLGTGAALLGWIVAASSGIAEQPRRLDKANVLPLALDDHFQFRKTELFLNDPKFFKPTTDEMVNFERERVNYKALTGVDQLERRGNYFTFFWRTDQKSDITVRLEYRQENLGAYVQAREAAYNNVKGTMKTKFAIIGDDYLQDGRVTAWRALLIEKGRIVGLTQSHLWN